MRRVTYGVSISIRKGATGFDVYVEAGVACRGPRLASLKSGKKHKSQRRIGPRGVISRLRLYANAC
jgi:hypothetical protein